MDYVVPEAKVVNYLLTSPKKSGFFLPLGYSIENWTKLRDDLLIVANNYPHFLGGLPPTETNTKLLERSMRPIVEP